jgi:hypothetical protein
MIAFLVAHPFLAILIWVVMYIFDFSSTLWLARNYQNNPNRHINYEGGVEMNPVFEKDIAGLRFISPRFLILLTLMVAVLVFIGLTDPLGSFEMVIGAFLLLWVFVDLRHVRNFYFYALLKARPQAMSGQVTQAYWLNQRLVAFDAFAYAAVYGLAWAASGRDFFSGATLVCALLAVRHFLLASRKPKIAG